MNKNKQYISDNEIKKRRSQIAKERQNAVIGVVILELLVVGFILFAYYFTPEVLVPLMKIIAPLVSVICIIIPFRLLHIVWSVTEEEIIKIDRFSRNTKGQTRPDIKQVIGYRWRRLKESVHKSS